ncbi:MAG: NADH-quinone oxidoreductase subunit NuoN [Sciscionella sp.]
MLVLAAAPLKVPGIDYGALSPVLIILGVACVSVLFEAFLPKELRWSSQVALTVIGLVASGIALGAYAVGAPSQGVSTISGTIAVDHPAMFLWGTLLALGFCAFLLIADRSVEPGGYFFPHRELAVGPGTTALPQTMRTEVFPLMLFSLGGMMTFCAANDLLTMFVALEVLSLPLYLMCGLARKRRLISQEASVKYFLLGAFGSAFFLYGLALLYGYAGSVKLSNIANAAAGTNRSDSLLFIGIGLLMVGLLFKGSVGPFHSWTPDVYVGAPTPITTFMAACTKVAAFGAILRVLTVSFHATSWEWRGVMWAVAIVSMAVGAIIGLTQTDMKRLLAYSSVAHAGFLLVGALAMTERGLSATLFYLLAYGFTTIAAFGVVTLVRDADGEATHLSAWAGLGKRSPLLAGVFTFLLLSFTGIPLTSGFVGKFAVFAAAMDDGMVPLVIVALVFSTIAAFFYLRVIVLMYFSEPKADGATVSVPGAFTTAAITLGVVVTLVLGVWPSFALGWAGGAGFGGL